MKCLQFILPALLLTACASAPDYAPASSARSAGYSETQIEQDRYLVSYRSKDRDTSEARRNALLRAAELTLQNGYDTFELVSQEANSETDRRLEPRYAGPDYVTTRSCGLIGCTERVTPVAPRDPFPTEVRRDETLVQLEIIMSDKDASVSPSLYDASEVWSLAMSQQ